MSSEEEFSDIPTPLSSQTIVYRLRFFFCLAALTIVQYGTISQTLQYTTMSFFAASHGEDDVDCGREPESRPCRKAAADVALYKGVSGAASHSVAWILALGLGSVSDRFGRRPLFRSKAMASAFPVLAFALYVHGGLSLWLYLVISPMYEAFDINGVFLAFMSDVITEPHERAAAFGVLVVVVIVLCGLVLPLGGYLSAESAVAVSLAAAAVKLLYVFTIFPETAPMLQSTKHSSSLLQVGRDALAVFTRHNFILRMVIVLVISGLSLAGLQTVAPAVLTGYIGMRKGNDSNLVGAACFASLLFSMGALLRPLVSRWGEVRTLQLSLLAALAYPLALNLCADVVQVVVLNACLVGPMTLQIPCISAIKSNLVNEDEQGLIQGALAATRVVAVAVADVFFGWFYRRATRNGAAEARSATYPPMLLVAGLMLLAAGVACSLPTEPPKPLAPDRARTRSTELVPIGRAERGAGGRDGAPEAGPCEVE